MIDLKILRDNPQFVRESARNKGIDLDIERILELDRRSRLLKAEIENIRAKKNEASSIIPKASAEERARIITEMRELDRRAETVTAEFTPIEEELRELLFRIPNPALADVKIGASDAENEILRQVGQLPSFDFVPKDHLTLAEGLGIVDMPRGVKVAGARFGFYKGDGVTLALALVQHALAITAQHGFTPMLVPHVVNADIMRAMGYLEHGGHDEIYYLAKDNLYLIGTAEQPLGGYHADEILDEKDLPTRYVAFSSCFRREAGSYGRDTRGLIRMHQFEKIEMFSYTTPEESDVEHDRLLAIEEELMRSLELPYQVIKQCTGDLGLPAARKFDIETWLPTQETYRETHSTSTCTDFQARRLNTRVRRADGRVELLHTLNGTAFAISRTMAAILENYQEADGSVRVPTVLQAYLKKDRLTPRG
jgi:seryl-tRNA synthetase